MKRIGFWIAMIALLCGCRTARHSSDVQGVHGLDILDLFDTVDKNAAAPGTSGSVERHAKVIRGGRPREAMVLVAPVTVRASLEGISGRFKLQLQAAPVFNIGDGMQVIVWLETSGNRKQVLERYFDAGRNAADRHWVFVEMPLDLSGARGQYLEVEVTGGPQGDLVTDWLALAEARLVQERIQSQKIPK